MLEGVFVKGNLAITVNKEKLSFIHWDISVFGVTGLPWGNLYPSENFGHFVLTEITLETPEKLVIKTPAQILREFTGQQSTMAIKFHLEPKEHLKLSNYIKSHGHPPSDYSRKYPRIPSTYVIQTFPLHAIAQLIKDGYGSKTEPSVIFNVENLSPNGILISTESSIASEIQTGQSLQITIDPRGWFPFQVHVRGVVCRIMEDVHNETKNISRRFGIKFVKLDEINQAAFLSLLNTILEELKQKNPSTPSSSSKTP